LERFLLEEFDKGKGFEFKNSKNLLISLKKWITLNKPEIPHFIRNDSLVDGWVGGRCEAPAARNKY